MTSTDTNKTHNPYGLLQMAKVAETYDELVNGRYSEIVRYLIFGVLNVFVTWIAYAAFVIVGIDPVLSNALSWVVGVIVAFVCNKFWVFRSKSTERSLVQKEVVKFFGERIFTGILSIVVFWLLYNAGIDQFIFGLDGFYAKIITTFMEIVLNFLISKYYVFRKNRQYAEE